ncbi:BQ5605_C002g01346 [Microbotryum silenes-dioicae]|uniref:BQ5605_C002g01346 protein n=1 Tax=Microbotryum silenes-dioicae TaxID=796604 RepID=A0A2X0LYF4_9BASI|nr:BQ5605_C002g01346 [Microbotryum silenes-dioicae]
MIVRQGKVKRMLEWLSHVCGFSREHLPPERQQPQHLIREIGLELVTSEALATLGMESKLRCLFSEHAATVWNLGNGQSIEVNMPNLTAKPQVVFIHHQLIIPKVVCAVIGKMHKGRIAWENLLDLPDYSRFHADVREGLFTGRKCVEGFPTPLP